MIEPLTAKEMLLRARAVNDLKYPEWTFGVCFLTDERLVEIEADPVPWRHRFKKWVFNMVHP